MSFISQLVARATAVFTSSSIQPLERGNRFLRRRALHLPKPGSLLAVSVDPRRIGHKTSPRELVDKVLRTCIRPPESQEVGFLYVPTEIKILQKESGEFLFCGL
jgi:hypothetical protein